MHSITVAIAGQDQASFAICEETLQQDPEISIVDCVTGSDVVSSVERLHPRILLLTLSAGAYPNCELVQAVHRKCPATQVILVATGPIDEETLIFALAMGARGYLEHATIGRHLVKAVHSIDQGEAWVPRKILGKMVERTLH